MYKNYPSTMYVQKKKKNVKHQSLCSSDIEEFDKCAVHCALCMF